MTTQTLKTVCSLVYAIIGIVNAAPQSKLPKGFIQCRKSDPALDECLKDGFQKGLPHLVEGVPSLGLMKIDPLRITKLEITQGAGPVSINLTFRDLDMSNLKYTVITKLHYDQENYNLNFETIRNTLVMKGDYEVDGKVLILPIVGTGKCEFSLEFSSTNSSVQFKPVDRNGVTHLDIEKISWGFFPINMHMQLDNLFNGDKALGDNMNIFLNENWREVITELQPAIEQVFGVAFKEIGMQILNRIPYNQLLLD